MPSRSTSDGPLQRAITDACLGADAGRAIAGDLRAFLVSRGVAPDDVDAIVAGPPRLALYRSLVRNGISGVVGRMLPRTRARMNTACTGRFDADLRAFVDEVGPRTHYVRDVPGELFAWASPRWRADPSIPAYLPDLAAHELAHFAVASAESAGTGIEVGEVALDRPLAFAESVRLAAYRWAVHELPADPGATVEPARRDVRLLAYRDPAHAVRWLDLTAIAAAILERLLTGETLGDAVAGACAAHDVMPGAVVTDVARLLSGLAARGVLLGAR